MSHWQGETSDRTMFLAMLSMCSSCPPTLSQRLNKQDVTQVLDGQPDTTSYLAAQNELNALGGTQKTEPMWDQKRNFEKNQFQKLYE